ncbi:MAG: long-chain fatty acid--CoA ligase [Myxococcota bacterium]
MSRNALDRAVLEWISEGALAPPDRERFDRLALALFAYQYEHNLPYRRFCTALALDPGQVNSFREIPAVPTGAFKEARLATFSPDQELRTFRTSGSTTERRGALHLDTLELYEASLLSTFGTYVCPEGKPIRFVVLAPTQRSAPESSLSYMFGCAVERLGLPSSRFYLTEADSNPGELALDLDTLDEPIALVGTAFAFVHLLDFLREHARRLFLPPGSRVMETGGLKGRVRELSREDLHESIAEWLGLPAERIVNQYGMCELGSQFYEPSLRTGRPTRTKQVPPWVRTRVVDPESLEDVATGETGILIHYDLTNTGSVLAVQTSDVGRLSPDGFEVLGRAPGAEARGCSIATDLLLGAP